MTSALLSQTMTALQGGDATPRDVASITASPRHDEELAAGTVIGDFQIESLLGRGGMAGVYRARQLSLDRTVALKVTPACRDDSRGCDEGRTMAALVHEHIVPVYSEQTIGQFRLLAMGFVAGPTLAEFLATQRQNRSPDAYVREFGHGLPNHGTRTSFACRTIRDLASALAHAHRLGILHCDIKPANVLFTPEGRALLTDFNVSVRRGGEAGGATSNPVGGTLAYMAPEHLELLTGRRSSTMIDERADIYSLGLVLFEMLTGDWPFQDSTVTDDPLSAAAQLQAVRLSTPVRFPTTARRLTPGLRSIVKKCLAPQPVERYQTAEELADDLDRYLTHRPLRFAADHSLRERCTKWVRRHPTWTVTAVAALVFVVLAMQAEELWSSPAIVGPASSSGPASATEARRATEWDRRGRELMPQQRFDEALRCFDQAVALNSQLAPAHHNRGVARFRLGQFASARESFDAAIHLGSTTGLLFSHRAVARFALGDATGAEEDFHRAREYAFSSELDEVLANAREFEQRRAAAAHP